MCGIAGLYAPGSTEGDGLEALAGTMAATLTHRGPDDHGTWVDARAGCALGHRRLAVIDTSAAGHQPMVSRSGRYVIAYNGEVYNFPQIRADLDIAWRGDSDTEVILEAIEARGLIPAVERFVGMFAFALWDRDERTLHLVRDRLGIKPLYYGWSGGAFLFGSELKALRAHPRFEGRVDREALTAYLRFSYVPSPRTIYEGVYKLPAGHVLNVKEADALRADSTPAECYWSARSVVEKPREGGEWSEREATDRLEAALTEAVKLRMISDVPLGALLSGGIDSTTVVALMQMQSTRPVRTFSVGFREGAYDEAQHARAVARHLGTEHTELCLEPQEALEVIPKLPQIYDEPLADPAQIPTYLVSKLARRDVTVGLSGDGGDELFAGYNRHFWGRALWNRLHGVPRPLRGLAQKGMAALSPRTWDGLFERLGPMLPSKLRHRAPGDRLHQLSSVMTVDSPEQMYLRLASRWLDPASAVVDGREPRTIVTDPATWPELDDFTERMLFLDLVTYLPDDVLAKVDRASMAVSLEARVPLLDHRVVELAWRLPLSMKIRHGEGKWILRQVLYRHVPRELVERPKTGFGVPLDAWLRGPLREWAEDELEQGRLRRDGFFDAAVVRECWRRHLSGAANLQRELWPVLVFQSWLRSA